MDFERFAEDASDALLVLRRDAIAYANPCARELLAGGQRLDEAGWALPDARASGQMDGRLGSTQWWALDDGTRAVRLRPAAVPAIGDVGQASQERHRHVMDGAPDPLLVLDIETLRYLDANRAACEELGYSLAQFRGLGPPDIVVGSTWERASAACALLVATAPQADKYTGRMRRADGSVFPVEIIRRAVRLDGRWVVIASTRNITEREQARARLERYRAAIDEASDGIVMIDPQAMRYLDVNQRMCDMLGVSREDCMRLGPAHWGQAAPEDTRRELAQLYQRCIDLHPQAMVGETELHTPDGRVLPVESSRRALYLEGRWIIVAMLRDISERKAAQAGLERLATAADQSVDAIAIVDPQTLDYLYVNQQACDLLGCPREELLRRGVVRAGMFAREHAALEREMREEYRRVMDLHPAHERHEIELPGSGAQAVPVERIRRAILSEGRWIIVVTMRDIRERRQARQRLERFRAAIDQSGDGIVMVDPQAQAYLEVNQKMADMLGTTREECLAAGPLDWMVREGDAGPAFLPELVRHCIDVHPASVVEETELRRVDGTRLPVESSRRAVPTAGGWIIVLTFRDITERRRAQAELDRRLQELARSNEDLERFAYIASHDLSEPLRMVGSYAELLQRRYRGKLDQDADEFIGYMTSGVRRMKQLIEDLLTYSRAGRGQKMPKPVDMNQVLDDVLKNLQELLKDKAASITRAELPMVMADRTSMIQLMQNLVANALKFTGKAAPQVRIEVGEEEGAWVFSVADNGIGIEPRHFQRIFEIFQRLHSREAYSGTGIGLSVCKKIVEAAGGRIWLESELGVGSTFHFTVPRA